jgi:hypothetical protein
MFLLAIPPFPKMAIKALHKPFLLLGFLPSLLFHFPAGGIVRRLTEMEK